MVYVLQHNKVINKTQKGTKTSAAMHRSNYKEDWGNYELRSNM